MVQGIGLSLQIIVLPGEVRKIPEQAGVLFYLLELPVQGPIGLGLHLDQHGGLVLETFGNALGVKLRGSKGQNN